MAAFNRLTSFAVGAFSAALTLWTIQRYPVPRARGHRSVQIAAASANPALVSHRWFWGGSGYRYCLASGRWVWTVWHGLGCFPGRELRGERYSNKPPRCQVSKTLSVCCSELLPPSFQKIVNNSPVYQYSLCLTGDFVIQSAGLLSH